MLTKNVVDLIQMLRNFGPDEILNQGMRKMLEEFPADAESLFIHRPVVPAPENTTIGGAAYLGAEQPWTVEEIEEECKALEELMKYSFYRNQQVRR